MESIRKWGRLAQWGALLAISLSAGWILEQAGFPAALLIGPMITAIGFGTAGARLRIPRTAFTSAQAVVGCLVARSLTAGILLAIAADWWLMLLVVFSTIATSALVGWTLVRLRVLPGATAAWGSSAGAASAMVVLAEAYGADPRLVGFMQYLRVVVVALSASAAASLLVGSGGLPAPALSPVIPGAVPEAIAGTALLPLLATLAVAATGALIARRIRVPAGSMLFPMLLAALAQTSGLLTITLPHWLLGLVYMVLGWYIGLAFNRDAVRGALRALPHMVAATVALVGLCGILAWGLTRILPIDGLTAILATSPGGLDSVAIIGAGSHADLPFVMAVQTLRLFVVILVGPPLARLVARAARPDPVA